MSWGSTVGARAFVHVRRLEGGLRMNPPELSAAERERAASFKFERDRNRYLECHVGLRCQLGEYLQCAPADVAIQLGQFGKPELAKREWHFNLSHSGDYWAAVHSPDQPVRIDIETGAQMGALVDLVDHVCAPDERAKIDSLEDEVQQKALFLAFWTGKEAFLKGIGCGFQVEPNSVRIVGDPLGSGTAEIEADLSGVDSGRWVLQYPKTSGGCALAIATTRGCRVELRESPFDA